MKNNTVKILISSVAILLPCLFGIIMWNNLPETMTTHFGADMVPDGVSSKAMAVFALPVVLLVIHLLCLFISSKDKRFKEQKGKAANMIYFIMPLLSIFVSAVIYALSLGYEIGARFLVIPFVVMAIGIGNYLPKVKPNHVMGVRLKWTLQSEENWVYTHRITGRVWFGCGASMPFTIFLPQTLMFIALGVILAVLIATPVVSSFGYYKKQKAEGRWPENPPSIYKDFVKNSKPAGIISGVIVAVILVLVAVLMFTGSVTAEVEDNTLIVRSEYQGDISVNLDKIDSVKLEENFDKGQRQFGFGSAKLSLGTFKNETFGTYTIYAYNSSSSAVVIESEGKYLAIALETDEANQKLFEKIENKLK